MIADTASFMCKRRLINYYLEGKNSLVGLSYDDALCLEPTIMKALNDSGDSKNANELLNIMAMKRISFCGYKDYYLELLSNWFLEAEFSPNDFMHISEELLGLNDFASKVGDNRSSFYVVNAIFKKAYAQGINTLYSFYNFFSAQDRDLAFGALFNCLVSEVDSLKNEEDIESSCSICEFLFDRVVRDDGIDSDDYKQKMLTFYKTILNKTVSPLLKSNILEYKIKAICYRGSSSGPAWVDGLAKIGSKNYLRKVNKQKKDEIYRNFQRIMDLAPSPLIKAQLVQQVLKPILMLDKYRTCWSSLNDDFLQRNYSSISEEIACNFFDSAITDFKEYGDIFSFARRLNVINLYYAKERNDVVSVFKGMLASTNKWVTNFGKWNYVEPVIILQKSPTTLSEMKKVLTVI